MNQKKINTIINTKKVFLELDENQFSKIIDNLLGNAIKYNKLKGTISINLTESFLKIKNTSIDVNPKDVSKMTSRYKRFDKSKGGFGIGLNIVQMICNENKWKIEINAKKDEWFEIKIYF